MPSGVMLPDPGSQGEGADSAGGAGAVVEEVEVPADLPQTLQTGTQTAPAAPPTQCAQPPFSRLCMHTRECTPHSHSTLPT